MLKHIKQHFYLVKVLTPYKRNHLVSYRSYLVYLFSYISRGFTAEEKLNILLNHYCYLQKRFEQNHLKALFKNGVECYKENIDGYAYSITLSYGALLEFEGSLSLNFRLNNTTISTLSFTFAPGKSFNVPDENVIYISGLQRDGKQLNENSRAKKHFKNISISVLLMTTLEAIAVCLQIKTCIGISARNQLSLNTEDEFIKFYSVYDQFWINNGGLFTNEGYVMAIPIPQKSPLSAQKNQREIMLLKSRQLEEIYNATYAGIKGLLV